MVNQIQKADQFKTLHISGKPLVLFNIWDVGSTKAVAASGAKAIATGSWSVASANGFKDGERVPLALAMDNLRRIVAATELPVTVDLERGYGETPEAVSKTLAAAIEAGAIGCNLEDSCPPDGKLRDVADQVKRIKHARLAADAAGIHFFINARTDVFFQGPATQHDEAMLSEAIVRARAYAEAGADGLFAPGLIDIALIARLAKASPLPLNIMMGGGSPSPHMLAESGVARISHGPGPYLLAMKALEEAARAAIAP